MVQKFVKNPPFTLHSAINERIDELPTTIEKKTDEI